MEEILSSIRRVIARDEGGRAGMTVPTVGGGKRKPPLDLDAAVPEDAFAGTDLEAAVVTSGDEDDVLELTDELGGGADDFANLVDDAAAELDRAAERPVLDQDLDGAMTPDEGHAPMAAAGQVAEMTNGHAPDGDGAHAVAPHVAAPLASPQPVAAARQSLDMLAAAVASAHPAPTVDTAQGPTVAALVDAALKPMLREWLDANLPTMVEGLVAAEIARITGSSRG